MIFGTENSVVVGDVYISRVGSDVEILRDIGVVVFLAGARDVHVVAENQRFFIGFVGEVAGYAVVGFFVFAKQVERYGRELLRRAALHKHNVVVFRDTHQFTQKFFGFRVDVHVPFRAVAHFANAHPGTVVVQ